VNVVARLRPTAQIRNGVRSGAGSNPERGNPERGHEPKNGIRGGRLELGGDGFARWPTRRPRSVQPDVHSAVRPAGQLSDRPGWGTQGRSGSAPGRPGPYPDGWARTIPLEGGTPTRPPGIGVGVFDPAGGEGAVLPMEIDGGVCPRMTQMTQMGSRHGGGPIASPGRDRPPRPLGDQGRLRFARRRRRASPSP
jgi:hypothetical protein